MAVLRYFHQDPRQTSVQESSVIDKQGTVLTQKLTTINQSITNNTQVLEDKLNSVPGKSLSTNDFTDEYKNKLRGIEEGAEVNVQSDWGEDDNTADSYIKNKPVIDDIVTQNSENLITSGAVFTAIDELPEPMIFKGSLGTGGTIQTLPAPSADNVGFVYKVITAGAYYGITAKSGDSFISDGSDWILIPSGDEPEGTVMSVGLSVPTGLLVSGSPITTSGTLAITYALGYAIPTTAKLDEWDAKQNAISDLSTIRTNASNGNTAYGWGNHANAGYLAAISDLATIRSNASEGHTAYGWGNHANAGYVKSSGVTSVAMTVPTGLSISGSPITSTGTLALSFANGYSIPTTAKLSNWDTAYGWGNHANAGYLTQHLSLAGYLPLSGGTMTGNISFSNSGTGFRGINYGTMGDNDQWRIGGAATGSNAGYMEIATADDGNEPIYVRLYTGVFTTLKRTLTLLDASGNTSMPGSVTAGSFVKSGGTSSLFLKADGSVDSNSYITGITKTMVTNALGYTPPTQDTNTTYSIATGDNNGQIKVTPSSGNAYNVSVKGLGSRAYDSTSYLPLAGGTMTGSLTVKQYILGYNYNHAGNNAPAFVFDKPGSNYTGIGAHTTADTIWFGAVALANDEASWVDSYKLKWVFNGTVTSDTFYGSLEGNATTATNADTVDGLHDSNLVRFFLSPMTSGAPADSAKSWFTGTMPSASGAIVYNVPGSEKTIIAGKSSGSYGHMLQLSYDDAYLRILRYQGGNWKSTDWEKISAGYADSAGSVAWTNVSDRPTNLNLFTNGPGYITSSSLGSYLPKNGSDYATWLRVVNNSSNNNDDALVFILNKSNNDWALKVDCTGYNYGINVITSDNASHAIYTNGRISCYSLKFMNTANVASGWNIYTEGYGLRILDSLGSSDRGAPYNYYSTALHVGGQYWFLLAFERGDNRLLYRGGNAEGVTRSWSRIHTYGDNEYACAGKMWIQCDTYDSHVIIGAEEKTDTTAGPWVGIGKVNPSYKLHVNGACGATSHPTTSDVRIKDIQSDVSLNLEDIANAPLFLFKWKEGGDNLTHVGTSAQYWKEKVPELVSEANDERKTLSLEYEVLGTAGSIAIAKEVVSLKEEIKLLQALIAELKLLLNN